jgi:drug/metabolite transporter (DMT)-like permease
VTIAFALVAAVGYGVSDFFAGAASRRAAVAHVAAIGQLGALVPVLLFLAADGRGATSAAILPGVVAGVGQIVGCLGLYRGLAVGRVGVVAPLSAISGAAFPLVAATLAGESLSMAAWFGVGIVVPALGLVAGGRSETPSPTGSRRPGRGAGYGLLGGCGFGLMYLGYGSAASAGGWPIAVCLTMGTCALLPWTLLRHGGSGKAVLTPLLAGAMAGISHIAFRLGATAGSTALASVIASLYPAVTVALATLFLGEPLGRVRAAGLALTMASIALMAL